MLRRPARRAKALIRAVSGSLAGRLVLGASAVIILALVAAAIALPSLYRVGLERQLDARLNEVIFELVGFIEEKNGRIVFTGRMSDRDYENAYSGDYWQIRRQGRVVLSSPSLSEWTLATRNPERLNDSIYEDVTFPAPPDGPQVLRAASRMLAYREKPDDPADPNRTFVFTVAANRALIDENISGFRVMIVLTIAGLGLVLVGSVFLQVRYGLRPLRRIPAALAAIRTGENDRLTGSFSAEVQPLAREINALLDHNAEVVERARTHVGNLAHALKTPLAVLTNETASREGEFPATVRNQVRIMREQVEHHLSRARMAARAGVLGTRTSAMPILEGLARTLEKIYRSRGIGFAAAGPETVAFRGEKQDLEEMLGNLMDNAGKWARSKVRATAAATGDSGRLIITVEDDGPGIPANQRRTALKRGMRLDEQAPGSGLGLSIVSDIAEIYGGSVTLGDSEWGGLKVTLDLPLAAAETPAGERPSTRLLPRLLGRSRQPPGA